MHPVITVFAASPDEGQGLARDMPVRWAMEEVGQRYEVMPVTFAEMKAEPHLARQPFGQIPTFEQGELVLIESGAIVLHIAEAGKGCYLTVPATEHGRSPGCSRPSVRLSQSLSSARARSTSKGTNRGTRSDL